MGAEKYLETWNMNYTGKHKDHSIEKSRKQSLDTEYSSKTRTLPLESPIYTSTVL